MEDVKQDEAQETMSISNRLKIRGNNTMVPNELIRFSGISVQARFLWIELFSYSFNAGAIFPGLDRVSKNLGWSRPTISKYRKELEKFGFLKVTRRGLNRTNLYELDVPVADDNADRNTDVNMGFDQDVKGGLYKEHPTKNTE